MAGICDWASSESLLRPLNLNPPASLAAIGRAWLSRASGYPAGGATLIRPRVRHLTHDKDAAMRRDLAIHWEATLEASGVTAVQDPSGSLPILPPLPHSRFAMWRGTPVRYR